MTDAFSCDQPGCTGTILDGYCDVCGSPPRDRSSTGDLPTDSSGGSSGSISGRTSSNRIAATAIGSKRVAPGSRVTRRLGSSSYGMRQARLGAGLTTVPSVPVTDPEQAIMADPQVPEERRFCSSCGGQVGRSRQGRPGRGEGYCPHCRTPFSFTPKLTPGTMVNGQYEVAGCLAHGGLGWIYLARDKNVSDRWVVLKGLLNAGDEDAYAAAVAERQFLAQVEHPLIVEIFNFVSHEGAGYTVMEYVGGTSLKAILKKRMVENGGRYDPIPVDQAIAYVVEILPAFSYLHDQGLLYCDFKPDNIIQVGDGVKLIDLGGVRLIRDLDSAIYGTVGYQAPEVPETGPSVPSDIFTVGRALAVLAMEFRGYQSTYVSSFPPVGEVPLFQRHDSLYRLLLKACAQDPADRFQSAEELRIQLLGVLREVVAEQQPEAGASRHSVASALFEAPAVASHTLDWRQLPALKVDPGDPMAATLAGLGVTDPQERMQALDRLSNRTVEVFLDRARTALESSRFDIVDSTVAALLNDDPWEWRAVWLSGLAALSRNDPMAARSAFNAVYGQVPGELAPKLALGLSCELSGEHSLAEAMYLACVRTDANYIAPAAFGLSRIRTVNDDLDGALDALDLVPTTSSAYVEARRRRAGLLAGSGRGLDGLAEAMDSIDSLTIDPVDRARLTANVLNVALDTVLRSGPVPGIRIAGTEANEPDLRDGLERAYRDLAALLPDHGERIRLVDAANDVRQWTMR
jgi:serine/threonine-protein kinase PknG